MGKNKEKHVDEETLGKIQRSPKLCGTNYPVSIAFIVVNEFCERFSYYGMKAVLTLYFIHYLGWDKNLSTAVYHAFSGLCYFTPLLGALIADSWLGKFKTIIYLSIVYVIGHVVKSVGAIPDVGNSTVHIVLSMIGLILIAFGTGGIKPCVAAFGGDQFDEEHTDERTKFFSIFYMSINAGSVLSTIITPILRGDVQCFGRDCYALAFGVPAVLMIIALVVFIAGNGLYKKSPPEGNVLLRVCKCIGFAIRNRWRNSTNGSKRKHWLDWAEEKFSKRLIQEIKMVFRVLVLYIPLPMFWALFDQQGSRWTLQATRMNMDFGGAFVLKPDQMQMLNALLILVFIPIFDMGVYPLIGLCRIKLTPLKKMAIGMILGALAFGAATIVEINVIKTVVKPPVARESLVQVYNLMDTEVSVQFPGQNIFSEPIKSYEHHLLHHGLFLHLLNCVSRTTVTSHLYILFFILCCCDFSGDNVLDELLLTHQMLNVAKEFENELQKSEITTSLVKNCNQNFDRNLKQASFCVLVIGGSEAVTWRVSTLCANPKSAVASISAGEAKAQNPLNSQSENGPADDSPSLAVQFRNSLRVASM
ncbi:solute carrier family 15 member 2 [Triplophysa rosa]|uniref:Solute carrier family 15 member 2 n=1 Tax=Triplophysa rosa TaxID=992332 RepID=A0A9W8C6N9_TRIRA|nr:solute carrier family 15 member 2 [Triplophysa rosa]